MLTGKRFYEYRPTAHFIVSDEDAADFLQSQLTNDLRPFEKGQCTYGLWLNAKGKVIADAFVLCEGGERFRVLSQRCSGSAIMAHLEHHIIADDVVLDSCEGGFALELTAEGITALNWDIPEVGRFVPGESGFVLSVREGSYHIICEHAAKYAALRTQLIAAGWSSLSDTERGLARIEAGIPLVPDEIGASELPGEGELESDAISFTKGCYLGQEVVARMHNLGKPQRRLFVLQGEGSPPHLPLVLYNSEAKEVGHLRTAYPDGDAWCGVALLKTRFVNSGSTLRNGNLNLSVLRPLREGLEHE